MDPRLKKVEAMAGMKKRPWVFRMPMTTAADGDEHQEGKHDVGQKPGQGDLAGDPAKIRGHDPDDLFGEEHPQEGDQGKKQGQGDQDIIGQTPGGLRPFVLIVIGKDGDKGGRRAPSANRSRSRLGMRKATTKASM